jgi:hypothetical protein
LPLDVPEAAVCAELLGWVAGAADVSDASLCERALWRFTARDAVLAAADVSALGFCVAPLRAVAPGRGASGWAGAPGAPVTPNSEGGGAEDPALEATPMITTAPPTPMRAPA